MPSKKKQKRTRPLPKLPSHKDMLRDSMAYIDKAFRTLCVIKEELEANVDRIYRPKSAKQRTEYWTCVHAVDHLDCIIGHLSEAMDVKVDLLGE